MTAVVTSLQQSAQAAAPATSPEDAQVSVDAMNLVVPGLIERVEV